MTITLNDDNINENLEDFVASLSFEFAVSGAIVLQPDEAMIQVTDNDGTCLKTVWHMCVFIGTIIYDDSCLKIIIVFSRCGDRV